MKNRIPKEQVTSSEIILYQTEDGQSRIQVRVEAQRELDLEATIRKFWIVQTERRF